MPIAIDKYKSAKRFTTPGEIEKEMQRAAESGNRNSMITIERNGRMSLTKSPLGQILPAAEFVMPDADKLKEMASSINLPWIDDYAERTIPWWASDERPDRHGDIVEQSWTFDSFKTNPVLLNQHEWDMPPIGNVLNWEVTNRVDGDAYTGPALLLLCTFATEDQYAVADCVFRLVQAKLLRTGSVGFYPGEVVYIQDAAERAELGLGPYGYVYRNNELLEFSMATIPANAGAYQLMAQAKSSGLLRSGDIAVIRETRRRQYVQSHKSNNQWREADIAYRLFWKTVFPEIDVTPSVELEEPIDILLEMAKAAESKTKVAPPPAKKTETQKANDDDDDDHVSMVDVLEAVTRSLTDMHGKQGEHTASLESLHEKVDAIKQAMDDDSSSDDDADTTKSKTAMAMILANAD